MVLVDWLGELLDPSTEVWGLHDSGAYQDITPLDQVGGHRLLGHKLSMSLMQDYYPFGLQCRDAYNMYQPPISSECRDQVGEDLLFR